MNALPFSHPLVSGLLGAAAGACLMAVLRSPPPPVQIVAPPKLKPVTTPQPSFHDQCIALSQAFQVWSENAQWDDGTTQFAYQAAIYGFEAVKVTSRIGGADGKAVENYYFRPVAHLTRPFVQGIPSAAPFFWTATSAPVARPTARGPVTTPADWAH